MQHSVSSDSEEKLFLDICVLGTVVFLICNVVMLLCNRATIYLGRAMTKRASEEGIEEHDVKRKLVKTQEKPLKCLLEAKAGFARKMTLTLPHGQVYTPVFMPVGTKGAMKGITTWQMQALGCRIMLSNTYHLGNKPGADYLQRVGGLHKFMNWHINILTDSGGFQMVSLSKLCEITEQGVHFQSPYDKTSMFIRPEDSIAMQNKIGSDIMMALDDVVKTTTVGPRMEEAMHRTVRWIDRNLQANQNPTRQNLFPIVQGGVSQSLRQQCLHELRTRDANGFAIGGLSGGQLKADFFRTVRQCCQELPDNKPKYLMGVGYPVDLMLCVALGVDMFDCVFPTRTARFGTALTTFGEIKLRNKIFQTDFRPLDIGCDCEACTHFTRAYLHMIEQQDTFCHLLSMHNINYLFRIMRQMRKAIEDQAVPVFLQTFLNNIYSSEKRVPSWVKTALDLAQIQIELEHPYYEEKEKGPKEQQNGNEVPEAPEKIITKEQKEGERLIVYEQVDQHQSN